LDAAENQLVLNTLNSERFADTAPAAVHATLLDEGRYLGSVRTMYRVLSANGASRERRNQRVHPAYTKPELLAVQPNQVWSWDITKLKVRPSGRVSTST
jgi:putative transposase